MRVLIAGATGFVGSEVVRQLSERGDEVVALVRSNLQVVHKAFTDVVQADLMEPQTLVKAVDSAKPEGVIFAAGERYPKGRVGDDYLARMQITRVQGTANLLDAISSLNPAPKFLSVSGALAYRRERVYKSEGLPPLSTEGDTIDESTWFGSTVAKWEAVVQKAVLERNLHCVIARLGGVYDWGGVWKDLFFEKMAKRKRVLVPGNGKFTTSVIHRADAARAIIYLLDKASPGEVYNVVDDEPVEFRSFIGHAAKLFGAPGPVYIPMALVRLATGAAYRLVRPAFSNSQAVSNRKLKKFGFSPEMPTYREGLDRVVSQAKVAN
jgi:nucleoside-diphosphate-sugar epimerase